MSKAKNNLSVIHKEDLQVTREIICRLMHKLEALSKEVETLEEVPSNWKYVWGEKENIVSSLTKLTGLLLKIIPLEQSVDDYYSSTTSLKKKPDPISKNDEEIINRYVERQIRIHEQKKKNKDTQKPN